MLTRGDTRRIWTCGATGWRRPRFRESLDIDATAYRLVHGEGDRMPALVVDRYGDHLVLQALSQGTDRLLPDITSMLVDLLKPAGILARNDPRVRLLEGLEQRVDVLHGEVPETIEVREGHVRYEVDPYRGQKTGLFLDQRENRAAAAQYARGRLLDTFSYNGGFALRSRRAATRCSRSTSPRTRSRASGSTPNATASPTSRRGR
jgi:23S rRNA (cytosine1962-C5)-methyltransferase